MDTTTTLLKQAREALWGVAQELHHIDSGPIKELGGVIAKVEDAAAAITPVVISEMETTTPETDAAEAMVEQANFENTGKGQERQRKEAAWEYARSLETRLAAAEAEIAVMRSGEVVAWATPDLWRVLSEAHRKREVEVGSTVFVGQFTIPLYRSPAPDEVVEARACTATEAAEAPSPVVMPEGVREAVIEAVAEVLGDAYDCIRVWDAWSYGTMGPDDFVSVAGQADRLAEIADAAISAYIRSLSSQAPAKGDVLRKLVEVADTNPFCSVGHFVEHVAPETRARLAALASHTNKGEQS